jgi:hypothetical protein
MSRPSNYPPEFRAREVQLYRDSEDRTIAGWPASWVWVQRRPASGCVRTRRTGVRHRRSQPGAVGGVVPVEARPAASAVSGTCSAPAWQVA